MHFDINYICIDAGPTFTNIVNNLTPVNESNAIRFQNIMSLQPLASSHKDHITCVA